MQFLSSSVVPMLANTIEGLLSLSLVFVRAKWWHALAIALLWGWSLYYFGPMPLN
ncbi:MAG TPA: hypothetical protein VHL34_05245 [Rhizomicrobium sp.]|nr:hypothetical protein [Rhizomicrobium sp.]